MTHAAITGWGKCLPPAILSNDDLTRILDTSDEAGFLEKPTTHQSGDDLPLTPRSMSVFKLSAGSQEHARTTSWKLRPVKRQLEQ